MSPGATLVLLTDGFYEAVDPNDEQFGEQRIVEFIKRKSATPLTQLIDDLHADIDRFTQGRRQADDLTAVLIRRCG